MKTIVRKFDLMPLLLVAMLLLCFGIVGRMDYEDAKLTERQPQDILAQRARLAARLQCQAPRDVEAPDQQEQRGHTAYALLRVPQDRIGATRCVDA